VFICADVNLLGENINAIINNAEIFLQASKATHWEVNVDKSKYMNMTQN
jgi:hypothetical protein